MSTPSYLLRRQELQTYFDRTAVDAWARLTSDAPLSGIRATVRQGRDRMRETLMGWLPADLSGQHLLDAGCGTGALSVTAAQRGADVVAIDLSPTLVDLAAKRAAGIPLAGTGRITFGAGDMLAAHHGHFDHAVAMDSLIHYDAGDLINALQLLAPRVRKSILFTFAPRTPALAAMHAIGRLLPRGDRAPAIEPVAPARLLRLLETARELNGWHVAGTARIASGFYISQAVQLARITGRAARPD